MSETSQEAPPLTTEQVERILASWRTTQDTCRDEPTVLTLSYPCDPNMCKDAFGGSMVVEQTRMLPENVANEARQYIYFLVSKYPFQLQAEMARPMWHRFLQFYMWTGNRQKALRHI